jgi:hypothetical protein
MNKKNKTYTQYKNSKTKILDPGGVVAFFQYVGLVVALLSLNMGLASLSLLRNLHINSETHKPKLITYEKQTYLPIKKNELAQNTSLIASGLNNPQVKGASAVNISVKPSKALNSLIAYSQEETKESLGAKACSFRHGDILYANDAKITVDKAQAANPFCVSAKNTNASRYHWDINGNVSMGNCIDLSMLDKSISTISVSVGDSSHSSVCSLLVRKTN